MENERKHQVEIRFEIKFRFTLIQKFCSLVYRNSV